MAQNQQTPPSGNDVAGSALFKKFISTAEGYIKQPTRLKSLLTDAYKKASDKNEVGTLAHEAWETLQTMFRLIKASISGEYTGVPTSTVAAAVAVLIYFISPIDLIPDFIPVLGLLDDVALVAWFSTTLKHEMDRFHEWELTRPALATESASSETDSQKSAAERMASSMAAGPASAAAPEQPYPARESAKQHGTHSESGTTPSSHQQSNTDSGLGSPESSSPRPVHEAGDDAQPTGPTNGPTTSAWEGSRNEGDAGRLDTGGNVR
ncbi:hypothetical protein GCM10022409_22480 [Hymenobacter glaciei]|uniref:DUF1232 domain-containing protein n=1 Tax=Hymenobacter glaciei TaxID=877209 RepID=A0ABP7U6S3_9BACT